MSKDRVGLKNQSLVGLAALHRRAHGRDHLPDNLIPAIVQLCRTLRESDVPAAMFYAAELARDRVVTLRRTFQIRPDSLADARVVIDRLRSSAPVLG